VNVPEGWLLCDGQAYGRTEHSELFQVIGTAWGSPDDSRFNVPDLRGVFLRGLDRGTGKDPDAGSRVAIMPRGNTGNNVGSYQDDVFQGHKHHTSNGMNIGGDGTGFPWGYGAERTYYSNTAGSISAGYGTPRMSDETRSKNAAVNYIIKL
ncbi:MAG: hypothetical protein GY754_41195, partial [bacterium]|nr:hypothetical protein [bacterium]